MTHIMGQGLKVFTLHYFHFTLDASYLGLKVWFPSFLLYHILILNVDGQ